MVLRRKYRGLTWDRRAGALIGVPVLSLAGVSVGLGAAGGMLTMCQRN